jgi:hypothetical protein
VAGNPVTLTDPKGLALYIKIPTRDEYEATLSSFGLGGLPDWLKDAMYEGYKNPDPTDLMGGIGFGGRAAGKIGSSCKFIQRAKETIGIFPTKIGGGGKLQSFSKLTGEWVSESKTISNRIYTALNDQRVSFTVGLIEGFSAGYSGVDYKPTVNRAQTWGQGVGKILGTIWGAF